MSNTSTPSNTLHHRRASSLDSFVPADEPSHPIMGDKNPFRFPNSTPDATHLAAEEPAKPKVSIFETIYNFVTGIAAFTLASVRHTSTSWPLAVVIIFWAVIFFVGISLIAAGLSSFFGCFAWVWYPFEIVRYWILPTSLIDGSKAVAGTAGATTASLTTWGYIACNVLRRKSACITPTKTQPIDALEAGDLFAKILPVSPILVARPSIPWFAVQEVGYALEIGPDAEVQRRNSDDLLQFSVLLKALNKELNAIEDRSVSSTRDMASAVKEITKLLRGGLSQSSVHKSASDKINKALGRFAKDLRVLLKTIGGAQVLVEQGETVRSTILKHVYDIKKSLRHTFLVYNWFGRIIFTAMDSLGLGDSIDPELSANLSQTEGVTTLLSGLGRSLEQTAFTLARLIADIERIQDDGALEVTDTLMIRLAGVNQRLEDMTALAEGWDTTVGEFTQAREVIRQATLQEHERMQEYKWRV